MFLIKIRFRPDFPTTKGMQAEVEWIIAQKCLWIISINTWVVGFLVRFIFYYLSHCFGPGKIPVLFNIDVIRIRCLIYFVGKKFSRPIFQEPVFQQPFFNSLKIIWFPVVFHLYKYLLHFYILNTNFLVKHIPSTFLYTVYLF